MMSFLDTSHSKRQGRPGDSGLLPTPFPRLRAIFTFRYVPWGLKLFRMNKERKLNPDQNNLENSICTLKDGH